MRILFRFIALCFILSCGCAGMRIERDVLQGNIFYSRALPKIRMQIHSDLEYIGKAETTRRIEYTDWEGGSPVDRESYLFARTEDNRILEGVLIRISTLRTEGAYWLPDLFARIKDKLDSGTMKIQGRRYQYSVFATSGVFLRYEGDFLTDKGYLIPNCFLVKGLARIVDADASTLMYILYMEDPGRIRGRKYSCRDWINTNMLTNEQREFLKGFIDRREKNIQILGKEEVRKEITAQKGAMKKIVAKKTELQYLAEPYKVIFTTGLEDKKPTNDLTEISINEKRIYIFIKWRLSLEEHHYNSKIFDGSGELVHKGQYKFKATKANWNTWTWHTINKHIDKPGKWKFEIHLDGRKMVEEYLTVLPQ